MKQTLVDIQTNYQKMLSSVIEPQNMLSALKKFAFFVAVFIPLTIIGSFIPEGYDWVNYFKLGLIHPVWTPWTVPVINFLTPFGYGPVFALTLIGMAYRSYRYNPSPFPIILAIFSLPTLWVFYLGNLDGLVLFGMLVMPFGIPLVTMKPQVAAFALLARKNWFLTAAVWGLLSLVIWGFWPMRFFMVLTPEWKAEWMQDINIFPWGLLIALPFFWYSLGDEDLLMAAGSIATPHLFPYHFILLVPALSRMRWPWMVVTWAVSFTPLLANWYGPNAWHLGNLLSLCFWFGISLNMDRTGIHQRQQKVIAWTKTALRRA